MFKKVFFVVLVVSGYGVVLAGAKHNIALEWQGIVKVLHDLKALREREIGVRAHGGTPLYNAEINRRLKNIANNLSNVEDSRVEFLYQLEEYMPGLVRYPVLYQALGSIFLQQKYLWCPRRTRKEMMLKLFKSGIDEKELSNLTLEQLIVLDYLATTAFQAIKNAFSSPRSSVYESSGLADATIYKEMFERRFLARQSLFTEKLTEHLEYVRSVMVTLFAARGSASMMLFRELYPELYHFCEEISYF